MKRSARISKLKFSKYGCRCGFNAQEILGQLGFFAGHYSVGFEAETLDCEKPRL
jgi:hypothetical protein